MRFFAALLFLGFLSPSLVAAQVQQQQSIQCSGVVNCAQAMVVTTDRLVRENAQLRQRLGEIERKLWAIDSAQNMRRGAVRVPGANRGYRETTIVFQPAFRSPPMVFLSALTTYPIHHVIGINGVQLGILVQILLLLFVFRIQISLTQVMILLLMT